MSDPTCSILLVDDDPAVCTTLGDVLEVMHHQVEPAHSGHEALAACQRRVFDLAILDIGLPDFSGLELVSRLEKSHPEIEILIVTGQASYDHAMRAVSRSTIGFLVKPVDFDRLFAITAGVAQRKHLARQNQILLKNLQAAERSWESTFDAISDPIAVMDAKGRIQRANGAFHRSFGAFVGEVVGEPASRVLFGRPAAFPQGFCSEIGNTPLVERRYDLATPGSFEISCHSAEINKEMGVICIVRDVTQRAEAELERERLIHQLEEQNAELMRYAYTASHDLKSPLHTIKGFLGLIETNVKTGKTENLEGDLRRVSEAADCMGHLLDELLKLTQVGRVVNSPEEVALSSLAEEAVDLVFSELGESRPEIVKVTPEMPVVYGDRQRLLELFVALVENAVKFLGKTSRPRIEIGVEHRTEGPVFYVRDNGMGIDRLYHEKVFGLFDQLDPRYQGTGIGLPFARRIVEVHGGRIWVESEGLGAGSSFYFTLRGHCELEPVSGRASAWPSPKRDG